MTRFEVLYMCMHHMILSFTLSIYNIVIAGGKARSQLDFKPIYGRVRAYIHTHSVASSDKAIRFAPHRFASNDIHQEQTQPSKRVRVCLHTHSHFLRIFQVHTQMYTCIAYTHTHTLCSRAWMRTCSTCN